MLCADICDLKIVPVEVERVAVAGFIVKDQPKRSHAVAIALAPVLPGTPAGSAVVRPLVLRSIHKEMDCTPP